MTSENQALKTFLLSTLLVLIVWNTGCSREEEKVQEYLEESKISSLELKNAVEEMGDDGFAELREEVVSGEYEEYSIRSRLQQYGEPIAQEWRRLGDLNPPANARVLHEAKVERYYQSLRVLDELGSLLDARSEPGVQKSTMDSSEAEETLQEESESAKKRMEEHLLKINMYAEKCALQSKTIEAELERLENELGTQETS